MKSGKAHHMLLFSCGRPKGKVGTTWNPYSVATLCHDTERLIYVWARSSDGSTPGSFTLPENVTMTLNASNKDSAYLVLQAHYAEKSSIKDRSGIRLTIRNTR